MSYYKLAIFFISLTAHASILKIGSIDKNLGFVKKESVLKILSCTTNISESEIEISEFPKTRVIKNFNANILDGYYPVSSLENESQDGLYPLYIDEFLLISLHEIKIDHPLTIGVIGDSLEYIKRFVPNSSQLYKVQSVDALFGGLARQRSNVIAIRRSQIPDGFKLDSYFVRSLYFENMGVKINNSFLVKAKSSVNLLGLKFKECLEDFKFVLDEEKKNEIYIKLKNDFAKISKNFAKTLPIVTEVNIKETLWRSSPSESRKLLVQSILESEYSVNLKKKLQKYNFITEAFVFDRGGALLGSISESSDFDQSDEEKYKLIKNSKSFNIEHILSIYFDSSTGRFQLGATLPLFGKDGEFIGGIYFASDINQLLHYYEIK